MKKIYSFIIGLTLATTLHAQVGRTVLIEESSNASCGPCAQQNPAFHALLEPNEDIGKIVVLKYQYDYPGYDPMNEDNPTEAEGRTTSYYGQTGVPVAMIDGVVPDDSYCGGCGEWQVAQGGYEGGPYGYNQNVIDYAYAKTSPFEIGLTSEVNNTQDTIFVRMVVRAKQAFTAAGTSSLKARIAVIEEVIEFNSAPGSNGEKVFYSIMKKFLPNMTGTSLTKTWADGDSVVIEQYWPFGNGSWNVYDIEKLGVVAFVQDDNNNTNASPSYPAKTVHQAKFDKPSYDLDVLIDASANTLKHSNSFACSSQIAPVVEITNRGASTLTSTMINYSINGGATKLYSWTGNLGTYETEVVNLPLTSYISSGGNNTINAWTTSPNSSADEVPANDAAAAFTFTDAPIADTLTLQLEVKTDGYGEETAWELKKDGVVIDEKWGYTNNTTTSQDIILDGDGCYEFIVYDSYGDGILSNGYVRLRQAAGLLLNFPGNSFDGEASGGFDVNFVNSVSNKISGQAVSVFPNPNDGNFSVQIKSDKNVAYTIAVSNVIGQTVYSDSISAGSGVNTKSINLSRLESGVYFVRLSDGSKETVRKVTIN